MSLRLTAEAPSSISIPVAQAVGEAGHVSYWSAQPSCSSVRPRREWLAVAKIVSMAVPTHSSNGLRRSKTLDGIAHRGRHRVITPSTNLPAEPDVPPSV
jgi:hypothetical protein